MKFTVADKACDARATWTVTFGDRYLGAVSEYGPNDYRITDAGPYCSVSRHEQHRTQIGAACALMTARRTNPAEQVDASGLMQIERDVLAFEGRRDGASERERCIEAAGLGITVTAYRQILRHLRSDAQAYALNPQAVERMRAQHNAAVARTARFRPQAPVRLAEAS